MKLELGIQGPAFVFQCLGPDAIPVEVRAPKEELTGEPAMLNDTTETPVGAPLAPAFCGYADVNGIKLYHEIYGQVHRWYCSTAG